MVAFCISSLQRRDTRRNTNRATIIALLTRRVSNQWLLFVFLLCEAKKKYKPRNNYCAFCIFSLLRKKEIQKAIMVAFCISSLLCKEEIQTAQQLLRFAQSWKGFFVLELFSFERKFFRYPYIYKSNNKRISSSYIFLILNCFMAS